MIGQTLGHYRIEAQLGAGGMGVVYRARDTRLERTVAVKLIGERLLPDAAARERLVREARTASALNHPHICTIFEVGEAGGHAYIAMEHVEGQPLSALVPAGGLPVEAVLRYGSQVADALAHAHERSVIHRDLKSANVVITSEGRAKVLDFGLAQRLRKQELEEATGSQLSLSEAGSGAGTLHYMAPEVLRGEAADARSDIWALGVLLYEMATGELPFKGQTGYELSSAILREPPAPLPARVSAGLRAIIQRCLAKEPGQRYQRASEVRAALEALESDTAIAPVAPQAARRLWLWPVAAGLLLIGGGIVAAVIRGVPFTIGYTRVEKREPLAGARLSTGGKPSSNPEANEYFEKAMLFLKTQYDLPRARQMLERALELDPHFAEARGWYGFTHVLIIDGGYSNDTSLLYKAEEELRRALQDDPNCGRAHSGLAAVYFLQGRKELVPGEVEKALAANPDEPDAPIWLIDYHVSNGNFAVAQDVAKRLMERDPLFYPARMLFGQTLLLQGDTAGAVRAYEKILEQDPQNIYALEMLSKAYMITGDLRRARQTLERVRPRERESYRVGLSWALLLALEGKRAEAVKRMDDESLKYGTVYVWFTLSVAETYAVMGDVDNALEWLERAVRNGDERGEWFRRDPLLAGIREHPRFKQILESIAYRRQQRAQAAPQR